MSVFETHDEPWTRKHDDPRTPLFRQVPVIAYPRSRAELSALLANAGGQQRFRAAGSHWSLSPAAQSDGTFIETHDPLERYPAMGRTLTEVLPRCLSAAQLDRMGEDRSAELGSLVHVESGKRIYQAYAELDQVDDLQDGATLAGYLYRHYEGNDAYAGPWAFSTLGGAGGQTVVGAFSTGTHGGDFDRGPLSDSVQALHLVVDGGQEYWIEPERSAWGVPLTHDARLHVAYGDRLKILRSDEVFDAVLVSVGRFGVVYSVVLRVEQQYALHEVRSLHRWENVKSLLRDEKSWPFTGRDADGTPNRFLQVAVCLTPFGDGDHLAGVTRRFPGPAAGRPGHDERVGDAGPYDPLIGAPRFTRAGLGPAFRHDDDDPTKGADPDPLSIICSHRSVVDGALALAVQELEEFVDTGVALAGGVVAAVAVPVVGPAGGLLALLGALRDLLDLARDLLDSLGVDVRLGEVLDALRRLLLGNPATRAAGVFLWRCFAYAVFRSQQGAQDYTALSYAVMDLHDYTNRGCDVDVDSIEVFFDADTDDVVAFVDALLAYEAAQEHHGLAFVGYASLRFTGPTRALLGPQRWRRTVVVEVACLRDVEGSQQVIDRASRLALDPNYHAVLHWGQHHDGEERHTRRAFPDLDRWRQALTDLTGGRPGFSTDFSRRTGLEP